jgi:hypothetical protein
MKKLSFWGLVVVLSLSLAIPVFAGRGTCVGGYGPGSGNRIGKQQKLRDGSGIGNPIRQRLRDGSCINTK